METIHLVEVGRKNLEVRVIEWDGYFRAEIAGFGEYGTGWTKTAAIADALNGFSLLIGLLAETLLETA